MSVYYEVNEHLVIKDADRHWMAAATAVSQLCLMGAWMLQDRVDIQKIAVIADGREYRFSGSTVSEDYHTMIRALRNAHSLEILSSYGYSWVSMDLDPGPFTMVAHLQDAARENPDQLRGMFYSMYHNADCGDGAGSIVAFGEKGGRLYTGQVPFAQVTSIPSGDWYTPRTALCYESGDPEDRDPEAIEAVCRQLCEFSCMDDLSRAEDGSISFFLNNLRLQNDAQLKDFLRLYTRLAELTGGECGLIGELADVGSPDVRILHFDVDPEGTPLLKLAAVA